MAKIPRVSLKGQPVPIERTADYTPHAVARELAGDANYGVRTNTPAAQEARAVLARRSRGHALGPVRLVPKDPAQPA